MTSIPNTTWAVAPDPFQPTFRIEQMPVDEQLQFPRFIINPHIYTELTGLTTMRSGVITHQRDSRRKTNAEIVKEIIGASIFYRRQPDQDCLLNNLMEDECELILDGSRFLLVWNETLLKECCPDKLIIWNYFEVVHAFHITDEISPKYIRTHYNEISHRRYGGW